MTRIDTSKSIGMAFGVFDGFHPGHEFFLSEAAKGCDELVVVVTLSEIAQILKGKLPTHDFSERASRIKRLGSHFKVVPGDKKIGSWDVLKTYSPDIVFLGYDQQGIAKELDKLNVKYAFLDAHMPEKYKSSLRKK